MDNFAAIDELVILSPTGRKKRVNPGSSALAISKKLRHSGDGKIPSICVYTMHVISVWRVRYRIFFDLNWIYLI